MKQKDFSNLKFWCSEIHSLYSIPQGVTMPTKSDLKKCEKLMNSPDEKSKEELDFLNKCENKTAIYNDPPISKTTQTALLRQYGRMVYNKKIAANGVGQFSFIKKGSDMEVDAVELLSRIDKTDYKLENVNVENEYILGCCDILDRQKDKVIDTKVSWNINTFLKSRTAKFDDKYWYQMQGYMELYDVNQAEVVFLLLNTPPGLIEIEKIKLLNRFVLGQVDRDKYDLDMENIESAFTYNNIPIKRRYFRYKVKREPEIFKNMYKKVEKARIWLSEFEQVMKINTFIVPSDKYICAEKDNTEHNTEEPLENHAG